LRSVSSVVRALEARSHVVGTLSESPAWRMSRVRLYSLVLFAVAESSLRPWVLSDGASQQLLVVVNSWFDSEERQCDHRHQVVGAQPALDELLGASLTAASAEARVQIRRRPSS